MTSLNTTPTENWMPFPQNATETDVATMRAYPHLSKYLSENTAMSAYFIGGIEIYKSDTGSFYWLDMGDNAKEAFAFGDTYPVSELNPLPDNLLSQVHDLESANSETAPFGFHVVEIDYIDADSVMFTLYSEELQAYCVMERVSVECLAEHTYQQFADLNPLPNTLATAYPLSLDEDGNIIMDEEEYHV